MSYKHFEIRDSDEFIRLIVLDDNAVGDPRRVTLDSRMVCKNGICYEIPAHIPTELVADGMLVPCETQFTGSTQYILNPEREEEWMRAEEARIAHCRTTLETRYAKRLLTGGSYVSAFHPIHARDDRGFMFHDAHGHTYIVMLDGHVVPIPTIVTL